MASKNKNEYSVSDEAIDEYIKNGYESAYKNQIDSTLASINKDRNFSYDAGIDPTYQALKKQYTELGSKAMKDTQAQSAALTGGYGNSYGQVAGQAVYNEYMSKLGDKIPELEYNAYARHQNDQAEKYNYLSTILGLDSDAYGRWNDGYSKLADKYQRDAAERSYQYQLARDEIADKRYEDETAYNRSLDSKAYSKASSGSSSSSGSKSNETVAGNKMSDNALKYTVNKLSGLDNTEIYKYVSSLAKSGVDSDQIYDILSQLGISDVASFLRTGGTYHTLNPITNREAIVR